MLVQLLVQLPLLQTARVHPRLQSNASHYCYEGRVAVQPPRCCITHVAPSACTHLARLHHPGCCAYCLQAVRDQIRKMVVGGPLAAEDKGRIDAVSDSEDDEGELAALQSDATRWGTAGNGSCSCRLPGPRSAAEPTSCLGPRRRGELAGQWRQHGRWQLAQQQARWQAVTEAVTGVQQQRQASDSSGSSSATGRYSLPPPLGRKPPRSVFCIAVCLPL